MLDTVFLLIHTLLTSTFIYMCFILAKPFRDEVSYTCKDLSISLPRMRTFSHMTLLAPEKTGLSDHTFLFVLLFGGWFLCVGYVFL
jgi:hypothetical protein